MWKTNGSQWSRRWRTMDVDCTDIREAMDVDYPNEDEIACSELEVIWWGTDEHENIHLLAAKKCVWLGTLTTIPNLMAKREVLPTT